jgi:hypothetical protein
VEWGDIEMRNIGHVHYSPPTSVDAEGKTNIPNLQCTFYRKRYTEDWGTFKLNEAQFKAQFSGNVVDLGAFIFLLFTSPNKK